MILKLLGLALISGVLYRFGGVGKPYNTKYRDMGVPLVMLYAMYILGAWNWWLILCYGLMFGALTTYWDSVLGYDNFWVHGFMIGLAMFPFAWATGQWIGLGLYSVLLGLTVGGWSEWIGEDWLEEGGRGVLCIALLPLLLV